MSDDLTGVETICSTGYAFAALKTDGSVVTWGWERCGGTAPCDWLATELAGVNASIWPLFPPEVGGPCAGDSMTSPESYCGDGTSWDAAAGTCTAAASEETPHCFLSGVCSAFGKEASYGHVDFVEAVDISESCRNLYAFGADASEGGYSGTFLFYTLEQCE